VLCETAQPVEPIEPAGSLGIVAFALLTDKVGQPTARVAAAGRDIDLVAAFLKWSEEFIEQPNDVFGGLPICPFARAARLKQTIRFEVRSFAMDDPLELGGALLALVSEFAEQTKIDGVETLFVIHPDRTQSLPALEAFVQRLNARMASGDLRGFQAFEAHPDSKFRIGGVYTRQSPFPSFQVLSRDLLKKGSDSLLGSTYYAQFTPEMLRAVGMPR
jgi:hypothetical protein